MAIDIYYSVGTSRDSAIDLKTGSPSVSVSAGVAEFTEDQTGDIIAGDEVIIAGSFYVYLVSKIDNKKWNVVDKKGIAPISIPLNTVTTIQRAFASLSDALGGASAGIGDLQHLETYSIESNNYKVNLTLAKDIDYGNDTTNFTISAFTDVNDTDNFIEVYAPINIGIDCNFSQGHNGKPGTGYILDCSASPVEAINFAFYNNYIKFRRFEIIGAGKGVSGSIAINCDLVQYLCDSIIIHESNYGAYFSRNSIFYGINFKNCLFYNNNVAIRHVSGGSGWGTLRVSYCTIAKCNYGIVGDSTGTQKIYINNTIIKTSISNLFNTGSAYIDYWYCVLSDPKYETVYLNSVEDSTNVFNANINFVDEDSDDYRLSYLDTHSINTGLELLSPIENNQNFYTPFVSNKVYDVDGGFTSDLLKRFLAVRLDLKPFPTISKIENVASSDTLFLKDNIFGTNSRYLINPEFPIETFSDDISGLDRGGVWDRGAYKYDQSAAMVGKVENYYLSLMNFLSGVEYE